MKGCKMNQEMKNGNNTGAGAEGKLTAEEQSRMKELTEILNRASTCEMG